MDYINKLAQRVQKRTTLGRSIVLTIIKNKQGHCNLKLLQQGFKWNNYIQQHKNCHPQYVSWSVPPLDTHLNNDDSNTDADKRALIIFQPVRERIVAIL